MALRRGLPDDAINITVERIGFAPKVMTLDAWFHANGFGGEDQEEDRIAIRFAMDAQFEFWRDGAVLSRIV